MNSIRRKAAPGSAHAKFPVWKTKILRVRGRGNEREASLREDVWNSTIILSQVSSFTPSLKMHDDEHTVGYHSAQERPVLEAALDYWTPPEWVLHMAWGKTYQCLGQTFECIRHSLNISVVSSFQICRSMHIP